MASGHIPCVTSKVKVYYCSYRFLEETHFCCTGRIQEISLKLAQKEMQHVDVSCHWYHLSLSGHVKKADKI